MADEQPVSTEQDSVQRLAEIRERAEKATPGPWGWWKYGLRQGECGPYIIRDAEEGVREGMGLYPLTAEQGDADSDFIAHSREDVPYLLSLIDSLTAERDLANDAADELIEAFANDKFLKESEKQRIRAEAAEAEVKRLREALMAQVMWVNGNTDPLKAHTYDCSHKDLDPGDCTYLCMKIRAALAPPSEGGANNG